MQRHKLIATMSNGEDGWEFVEGPPQRASDDIICAKHPVDGIVSYFCTRCEQATCQHCRHDVHAGHAVTTLLAEVRFDEKKNSVFNCSIYFNSFFL